jgi:hypothetical protein
MLDADFAAVPADDCADHEAADGHDRQKGEPKGNQLKPIGMSERGSNHTASHNACIPAPDAAARTDWIILPAA